jgi:regulatory protein
MAKITALKVQQRNKDRVNVYLDGEYAFGLSRIVAAWLRIGQELEPEKAGQLQTADAQENALQKALHFLSFRPRSEQEVRDNLIKHEFSEGVIEEIIARLRRGNLVDDQAFAKMWVENRSEFRPRGGRLLRAELRQKGIPDPVIASTLAPLDENRLALKAARKNARRYRHLDQEAFQKKMFGFLARRGFPYEAISEVVPIVWDEATAGAHYHEEER